MTIRCAAVAMLVTITLPCQAIWVEDENLSAARDAGGINVTFTAGDLLEDGRHGWVVGSFRAHGDQRLAVFRTTDGRRTWTRVLTEIDVTPANAVEFVDENHGWLLARNEAIYRTDDGGRTWEQETILGGTWALHDLQMVDATHGFASGQVWREQRAAVFEYHPDEREWQQVLHENYGVFHALAAHRADSLWAAGLTLRGSCLSQRFAGGSWAMMDLPSAVRALSFTTARRGYAACTSGRVFETADAGALWREKGTPVLCDLDDIHFDGRDGIALSSAGELAIVTENGGDAWAVERTPEGAGALAWDGNDHFAIAPDGLYRRQEIARVGPVVVERPQLARVLDLAIALPEEHNWREATELRDAMNIERPALGIGGGRNQLRFSSFLDDGRHGWFHGMDWRNMRVLLRTTTGGEAWEKITPAPGLPRNTRGIQFVNETTGWLWGDTPFICRTNNGGETWAIEPMHGADTRSVQFVSGLSMFDARNGLALASVGADNDVLLQRQPATGTWHPIGTVPASSELATVPPDFIWLGPSTLWLRAGTDPLALEPIMERRQRHSFKRLLLHDRNIGWALPYQETFIYRTTDGGETWASRTFATDAANYAVDAAIIGPNKCYLLTRLGHILRTQDAGGSWEEVHRIPSEINPQRSYIHTFGRHVYATAGNEFWTTHPPREPARARHGGIDRTQPVLADRLLSWSAAASWRGDGVHPDTANIGRETVFRVQWDRRNAKKPGNLMLQMRLPEEAGPLPLLARLRPADWWATRETGAGDWGVAFTPTVPGSYEYRFFGTNEDGNEVVGEPTEWRTWTVE